MKKKRAKFTLIMCMNHVKKCLHHKNFSDDRISESQLIYEFDLDPSWQ